MSCGAFMGSDARSSTNMCRLSIRDEGVRVLAADFGVTAMKLNDERNKTRVFSSAGIATRLKEGVRDLASGRREACRNDVFSIGRLETLAR